MPNLCVGTLGSPSCPMDISGTAPKQTKQPIDVYIPSNAAPSLASLQEKQGTNTLFKSTDDSKVTKNKEKAAPQPPPQPPSKYQLYMAERLVSLKSYFEIQENIKDKV